MLKGCALLQVGNCLLWQNECNECAAVHPTGQLQMLSSKPAVCHQTSMRKQSSVKHTSCLLNQESVVFRKILHENSFYNKTHRGRWRAQTSYRARFPISSDSGLICKLIIQLQREQVRELLFLFICTVLSHCSLLFFCFTFLACRTNHTHLSKPNFISDLYEGLMLQNQMNNSKYLVFWIRTSFFLCTM